MKMSLTCQQNNNFDIIFIRFICTE